jgi:hypothetical protein
MIVLGCAIALVWGCSIVLVGTLFYRAERNSRSAAAEWGEADYRARRLEQFEAADGHQPLPDQSAASPTSPSADH